MCGICARAVSEGKLKRDVTAKGDPSFVSFYSYFIESVHYHHFRPQELGFCNWKDATNSFRKHEPSLFHKEALEMMVTLPSKCKDIGELQKLKQTPRVLPRPF